jgi:hypothetical protein
MWAPEPWQVIYYPNPARGNAIWLGTVWNICLLPTRLWIESLRLLFTPAYAMVPGTFCAVLASTVRWITMGLRGKLRALAVPIHVRLDADIVPPRRAADLIRGGDARCVVDRLECRVD